MRWQPFQIGGCGLERPAMQMLMSKRLPEGPLKRRGGVTPRTFGLVLISLGLSCCKVFRGCVFRLPADYGPDLGRWP
jgi:hypothetical protein